MVCAVSSVSLQMRVYVQQTLSDVISTLANIVHSAIQFLRPIVCEPYREILIYTCNEFLEYSVKF